MIHSLRGLQPLLPRALPLASSPRGSLPDLEQSLRAGVVPAGALEVLQCVAAHPLAQPPDARLERCELSGAGDVFVAFSVGSLSAEVATGDVFSAGMACFWRADLAEMQVAPRIVRLVCSNGAVLPLTPLLGTEVYCWSLERGPSGDLERTLACSLSGEVVDRVTERLAAARAMFVADPAAAVLDPRLDLDADMGAQVLMVFEHGGDPSWYGLLNAVTQTARDIEDLSARLRLEQAGGRLVARFHHPHSTPMLATT